MDDGGAGLVALLLGDPLGLEGGEGGHDGATDPDGVLPVWWSDDVNLCVVRGEACDLLSHAVSKAREHGITDPGGVLPLRWSDDVDRRVVGDKFGYRLLYTVSEAWEHGRTSGQDDMGVEDLPDVKHHTSRWSHIVSHQWPWEAQREPKCT